VVPLVLYTGEADWKRPRPLREMVGAPEVLAPFVPQWRTLFLNLARTPAEELARIGTATAMALRTLQAEADPAAALEQRVREALTALPEAGDPHAGEWLETAWFLLQLALHRRSEEEYTRIETLVLEHTRAARLTTAEEANRMSMTMADRLRQEGEQRTRASWLEQLLTARFGPVSDGVRRAIASADNASLERWWQAALHAESLEELHLPSA
jgi:hypothetical protein